MKEDVKGMLTSDLYALYMFVCSRPINNNHTAKEVVIERIAEIEEELYNRSFGFNPYKRK